MTAALHDLSLGELSRLIAARKLSPVELIEALIRRIEQHDAQLHAFVTPTFDLARRQARQAEAELAAGRSHGPLHGIPFGLKDIYDTAGILTTAHSRVFIDRIPAEDATATRRLYEAGAVLLGKLATHEMAHAGPSFDLPWPPARNPWNLAHFTGGSSTGSGAAVAAGLLPMALGSDTGGSIRGPASHCGVVGLMPTFGLVSRAGVITNSWTFDHCGPLARTVEGCALTLQALAAVLGGAQSLHTNARDEALALPTHAADYERYIRAKFAVMRDIASEAARFFQSKTQRDLRQRLGVTEAQRAELQQIAAVLIRESRNGL